MLRFETMRSAPDIVKVMQVTAALPSVAVMIITRMVSVMIGKLRLPGMANDDAAAVVHDQRIGINSIQRPDSSCPARHQQVKTLRRAESFQCIAIIRITLVAEQEDA